AGRLRQLAKNAQFFGAPVGLFVLIDHRMGPVQWMDLGIYLQSFMLRATEEGLATCAQGFWRRYDAVIKQHIQVPEEYLVAYGIALGYEDKHAPINTMRATRAEFAEWGQLVGF
ncbi:MAG: nitroreductase, partial [Comamonadaceae bacterium]|nr:nitroreductase [Comamonadaceae bacterium]